MISGKINQQDLPNGWDLKPLMEACQFLSTGVPEYKGEIEYFSTGSIQGKVNTPEGLYNFNDKPSRANRFVKCGDVLQARMAKTNKAVLVDKNLEDKLFSTGFIQLRPDERSDATSRYLYYLVQSDIFLKQRDEYATGSTQVALTDRGAKHVVIPVAPIKQQKLIVAEIEKQFSRLDEAITNFQRVKANLKRYKAAVLKAAVEGKLTEQWRKEHPDVEHASKLLERILAERRKLWEGKGKYKEPTAPDSTELPKLPKGWVWATVHQLAASEPNAITDGPFGSNLKTVHYTESGPRVIRLQNIGDAEFIDEKAHVSEAHYQRLIKHSTKPGDVIIAALGHPAPRACLVPLKLGKAIVKADCIRFRTAAPHLEPGYLMYALNSQPTQKRTAKIVHGIGRPRLNLGEIKSIMLPAPSHLEQVQILSEIEQRFSVIEGLERTLESNIMRAERLRRSILKGAFSGNLIGLKIDNSLKV